MFILENNLVISIQTAFYIYFVSAVTFALFGVLINNAIRGRIKPELVKVFSGKEMVQYTEHNGRWGYCFVKISDTVNNQILDESGKIIPARKKDLNRTLRARISRSRQVRVQTIESREPVENVNPEFVINKLILEEEDPELLEQKEKRKGYMVNVLKGEETVDKLYMGGR